MSILSAVGSSKAFQPEVVCKPVHQAATSSGAPSVAAVVVTFNRKMLLLECLQGLLSQTAPLDRIYIIDNASTDGTRETLEQAGFLTKPTIRYVPLASNMGGAGGFSAGLRTAFADGFDWFWLMDDDVEPYSDGLAQLLEFREASGCIHGRRRNPDGTPFPWGECFSERTVTTTPISDPNFITGSQALSINTGCFEGMLVSRQTVAQVGFPDADFFITWDDTYYGYLASRVTTVLIVNAFVLQRKLPFGSVKSRIYGDRFIQSSLALFYSHRNRWLIAKKLSVSRPPFWTATASFFFRAVFRELVLVRSTSRAKKILQGMLSGMRCQLQEDRIR
ncbi:MAG TPA: glycosyltransferase family 2 protein [Edaphobacter sp.]|nr:glycosyltransferase family 2 protein [Edaphobacter sp.]